VALAQRRRRHKLVESELLSDPAADERASTGGTPRSGTSYATTQSGSPARPEVGGHHSVPPVKRAVGPTDLRRRERTACTRMAALSVHASVQMESFRRPSLPGRDNPVPL
jgi:hypothetical protein